MKRFGVLLFTCCALLTAQAHAGYVKGYYRKDGSYVAPHWSGAGRSKNPFHHAKAKPHSQRWMGKGSRGYHGSTRRK